MALSSCPSSEQLEQMARHGISELNSGDAIFHIEQCDSCARFFDGATARSAGDSASCATLDDPGYPRAVGPFRILACLGAGGMGEVYLAWQPLMRKFCVVKTIRHDRVADLENQERFLLEIRAQAALSEKSEYIMPVLSADTDRDLNILYMVMPFFPGETLEQRLAGGDPLPNAEVIGIAQEFLQGIAVAHQAGMLHRDIKPSNIYLERRDEAIGRRRVRIIDFGLTKALKGSPGVTQAGATLGTPGYMAPEQLRGDEADARTDLFALGCTLYRMFTGELPFPGIDPKTKKFSWSEYRRQVLDPTFVPTLAAEPNAQPSPALNTLILRLLAKDAQSRPASANAVRNELLGIGANQPEAVTQTVDKPQPAQPVQAAPPVAAALEKKPRSIGCSITITLAACAAFASPLLLGTCLISFFIGSSDRKAIADAHAQIEDMKLQAQQNLEKLERRIEQERKEHEQRMNELRQREQFAALITNHQKRSEAEDQVKRDRDDEDRRVRDRNAEHQRQMAKIQADSATAAAAAEAAAAARPKYYHPSYYYRGYWFPW